MIWFYLAGWISGAATVVMVIRLWAYKHGTVVRVSEEDKERIEQTLNELKEKEANEERD